MIVLLLTMTASALASDTITINEGVELYYWDPNGPIYLFGTWSTEEDIALVCFSWALQHPDDSAFINEWDILPHEAGYSGSGCIESGSTVHYGIGKAVGSYGWTGIWLDYAVLANTGDAHERNYCGENEILLPSSFDDTSINWVERLPFTDDDSGPELMAEGGFAWFKFKNQAGGCMLSKEKVFINNTSQTINTKISEEVQEKTSYNFLAGLTFKNAFQATMGYSADKIATDSFSIEVEVSPGSKLQLLSISSVLTIEGEYYWAWGWLSNLNVVVVRPTDHFKWILREF